MYFEVFVVALLAGISPGPDFFLVMKNSLGFGRKAGIASSVGVATALAVHATYTILGLALLIQHYRYLFMAIQLLGAAYLIWLGVRTFAATFRPAPPATGPAVAEHGAVEAAAAGRKGLGEAFKNGFFCNILNPKAFIFYLSIFSQFMKPETPRWMAWIYGGEVVLTIGTWFVGVSLFISSPVFRRLYERGRQWLERLFGVILVYFAVRVAVGAIAGLRGA